MDSILLEDLGVFENENPLIMDGVDKYGHPSKDLAYRRLNPKYRPYSLLAVIFL